MESYMKIHNVFDDQFMYPLWLIYTSPYSKIYEAMQMMIYAKRCYRFDGTFKVGKKITINDETKRRVKSDDTTVLLIAMNEIGQIKSFKFSKSENNDDIKIVLKACNDLTQQEKNKEYLSPIWVVCDNASKCRNMVNGLNFIVKQDPFHVPPRFKKHCKLEFKSEVHREITSALWADGKLKEKKEMKECVLLNMEKVLSQNMVLANKINEFRGTLNSNLKQIENGDLSYDQNSPTHIENGIVTQVLSTSQLEGENSHINNLFSRNIGIQYAERILIIHFVKVNIRQGVKYGRFPMELNDLDLVELIRTTLLSRTTIISSSVDEWAMDILCNS